MDSPSEHPDIHEQIVSSLTSGVLAVDANGTLITANHAASRHLDVAAAHLAPGCALGAIPGVSGPLLRLMDELRARRGAVSRREVTIETAVGHKVLGVTASPLQGPEVFNGAIFLFIDLTDLRRLEKTAELNKQLAQIGELTAGVVHELRNPLSVIGGMAELLGRKSAEGDPVYQKAGTILAEARQMEQLISQFLNFAKPFALKQAVCAPMEIVERSVELVAPLAADRQVELWVETRAGLPKIHVDAPKLSQALSNILRNAVEVSAEGSRVQIGAIHQDGRIVFRIEDRGPGIHLEEGEDLFSAFFSKKEGGTGLGMSIVHRIVTAHEGEITFGNNDTGGAWFEVSLPLDMPEL